MQGQSFNPWRVVDFSSDIFLAQSPRLFLKLHAEHLRSQLNILIGKNKSSFTLWLIIAISF